MKTLNEMIEDDIDAIEWEKEKAEALPPGDEKFIRMETYKRILEILINAVEQVNEDHKYNAMTRATEHMRRMYERVDFLQDLKKQQIK